MFCFEYLPPPSLSLCAALMVSLFSLSWTQVVVVDLVQDWAKSKPAAANPPLLAPFLARLCSICHNEIVDSLVVRKFED